MKPNSPTPSPYASGGVRESARSYLAQLREDRLARRRGGAKQVPEQARSAAPRTSREAVEAPKPRVGKRGIRVNEQAAEAPKKPEPSASDPQEAKRARIRAGVAKTRAAAQAAQRKMREARVQQREAAARQRQAARCARRSPPTARRSVAQPAAPIIPKPAQSLTQLRGIGDAMCRRLADADVHSLSDLVATPADTLRSRLGPVSALANVEGWQAQARQLLSD